MIEAPEKIPSQSVCRQKTYPQLFAVVSWGCAATQWLAKVLNGHPEILCLHWGNGVAARFNSSMDSVEYLRFLAFLGQGYTTAGDVHGLPRTEIPRLKERFEGRFNAAIVVREPIARLRSQIALYEKNRGLNAWDLSYVETLLESKNIVATSEESKMFVLAASMLDAVTEESCHGTIYRVEDLTTNPDTLAALVGEISGGEISANREWLSTCLGLRKVNAHVEGQTWALTDWQVEVVRAVVSPESWRVYEELGYATPSFVG